MQAIIMAAGKGSRLGAITGNQPKSFIEINNRKLIEYNLDMLHKYSIRDIIIVTGYKSEAFEMLLNKRKSVRFVLNPFFDTTNVLSSFWFGQEYLKEDFIYMHADTLCDTSIFEELLEAKGDIVLPTDFKECDEEAMKVRIKDGTVYEINKTMNPEEADGEFIGIAKLSQNCIPILKQITNRIMREQKFSSFFEVALQEIMDRKLCEVRAIPTRGNFWCEIDFDVDYERAKENISDNLLSIDQFNEI